MILSRDDDGYRDSEMCSICGETVDIKFTWYGSTSVSEMRRRMVFDYFTLL